MVKAYDATIVGGGIAGLTAALTLGRARRSVAVVDDGHPRNEHAKHVGGFITRDGERPETILGAAREEVRRYSGRIESSTVALINANDAGFTVRTLTVGEVYNSRLVLLATGLIDELPSIAGLQERWGRDVFSCPYCHAWQFRDSHVVVSGSDSTVVARALSLYRWVERITLITSRACDVSDADLERLAACDISLIRGSVEQIDVRRDRLYGVRTLEGVDVSCEALSIAPESFARCPRVETSLSSDAFGYDTGNSGLKVDQYGRTSVEGLWAAGEIAGVHGGLLRSAASGSAVAMSMNGQLIAESIEDALTHRPVGTRA